MRKARYLLLSIACSLGLVGCAGSQAPTAAKSASAETTAWRIPPPKGSATWLDKQIIEHPNDPTPYLYERGKKAYDMKQYPAAIDYYSRAIDWYRQHAPTSRQLTDAIIARADAYVFNNQSQRAKDDLDAAIAATSDPIAKLPYLYARERYYRRAGQRDLAEADSHAATAIVRGDVIPRASAQVEARLKEIRELEPIVSQRLKEAAERLEPQPPVTLRNPLQPALATQQNRQSVDTQLRTSCGKHTFTVAEGVSVSWTCDRQGGIAITEAKLPVAVGQELLAQAARHGVKVSFDLALPFFAWWVKQPAQSFLTVRDQKKLGPDGVAVSDHLHYLLDLLRESRFAELRQIIVQYFATLTADPASNAPTTSRLQTTNSAQAGVLDFLGYPGVPDIVLLYDTPNSEARWFADCLTRELAAYNLSAVSNVKVEHAPYLIKLMSTAFRGSVSDLRNAKANDKVGMFHFLDDIAKWEPQPPIQTISNMVLGGPHERISPDVMSSLRRDPRTRQFVDQWSKEESGLRPASITGYISLQYLADPNRGGIWCRVYAHKIVDMARQDIARWVMLTFWDPNGKERALVWGDAVTNNLTIVVLDPIQELPELHKALKLPLEASHNTWSAAVGQNLLVLLSPEETAALLEPSGDVKLVDRLDRRGILGQSERFRKEFGIYRWSSDNVRRIVNEITAVLRSSEREGQ